MGALDVHALHRRGLKRDDPIEKRLGVLDELLGVEAELADRRVDIASFVVEPGMEISFKEKAHKLIRENMESMAGLEVPPWLDFKPGELTAKVQAMPAPQDVPFEVNMNLIIEFYR